MTLRLVAFQYFPSAGIDQLERCVRAQVAVVTVVKGRDEPLSFKHFSPDQTTRSTAIVVADVLSVP